MAGVPVTMRTAAIALADGRGVAAWWPAGRRPADARTADFTFDADALAAGDSASVSSVLRELRRAAGSGVVSLEITLASPWTSPRCITLAPMRATEAEMVLARDHARHFPLARAMPVVAAQATERVRRAPAPWLATDADARVLDALRRAAIDAGFRPGRITAAVAAWARATGDASQRAFVVGDEAAVLDARGGRVTQLRRCRREETGPAAHEATHALDIAARHAPTADGLEFVPAALSEERRIIATRWARRLALAGLAVFVLAGAVRWWSAQRAVRMVERERAALRATVSAVLAARDSLMALNDALEALRRAERAAPEWNSRLYALSAALPRDAYLTALRGAGDSVEVEGRAASAAPVFDALRQVRGVVSVRATAPIAVTESAGVAAERFSVVVRFGGGEQP